MFDIRLTNLPDALDLLGGSWPTHCVSLVDPGTVVDDRAPVHYVGECYDRTTTTTKKRDRRSRDALPSPAHAAGILATTANLTDEDRLLVHCHGCYGRSPAALMAILVQHGLKPAEAVAHVRSLRPQCQPNSLLIAHLDGALRLHGALMREASHTPPAGPGSRR
jgi:predicted protein tyrosine phosphatase